MSGNGNRIPCGTHDGTRFWLNSEPCGLICGCMTYLLIFYSQIATTRYVIMPWLGFSILGIINILVYNIFCFVAMYSHFKAMTTDPGSVPSCAIPLANDQQEVDYAAHERWNGTESVNNKYRKYCKRCKAFKPLRAHHCSICGRCIVKMDHHCPWVNNCVGIGNHKLFLLFIFWINVICDYALVLVACKYASCMLGRSECVETDDGNLCVILLMVEAALFGLFTLCMMGDQSTVISTNQTQIDRLKKAHHEIKVAYNEIFGCPADVSFQWRWLFPVAAIFPDHCRDAIFGYQLPSSPDREELTPLTSSTDDGSNPLHSDGGEIIQNFDRKQTSSVLLEEGALEMALVSHDLNNSPSTISIAPSVPLSSSRVSEVRTALEEDNIGAAPAIMHARREKSQ